MEVLYARCCGLDVHRSMVVACVSIIEAGQRRKESHTFGTTNRELLALRAWLLEQKCTHVGMESTGVLWRPVADRLAGDFELVLVNATHMKRVPGRKTDVQDAEWLTDLLQHGLLIPSFVPDQAQQDLRDLTRLRMHLLQDRSQVVNRLHKVLQQAGIKLSGVLSNILGVSGRAIVQALCAGESDPERLAGLVQQSVAHKHDQLVAALTGDLREHHRLLLRELLTQLDMLDRSIEHVELEIESRLHPVESTLLRLEAISGVSRHGPLPLPRCGSSGFLGRNVSWTPGECRQAAEWTQPTRQQICEVGISPGCSCHRSHQDLPWGTISSPAAAPRSQTSGCRCWAQHLSHFLSPDDHR